MLEDLKNKRVCFGSFDSAQAFILPAYYLKEQGLEPNRDYTMNRIDSDLGKHGDTGRSEYDILEKLKDMIEQSRETAEGSVQGLKISNGVDEYMNKLAELMEGTLSTTASLVSRAARWQISANCGCNVGSPPPKPTARQPASSSSINQANTWSAVNVALVLGA